MERIGIIGHIGHGKTVAADLDRAPKVIVVNDTKFAAPPIPIHACESMHYKDPPRPLTRNERRRIKRLGKI